MRRGSFVVLLGVLVLSGCAENGDANEGLGLSTPSSATPSVVVELPDPPETVGAEPSASEGVPVGETAVLEAYRAFYAALDQAQADPQNSQVYLEPVATGAQFEQANGAIKANFLAGEESVGTPVLRPTVHRLDADHAVVQDCQDTTAVVRRDIESREPLIIGQDPDSLEATLVQEDGVWKVAATSFPDDPGAFC